jgi:hypothetical protein
MVAVSEANYAIVADDVDGAAVLLARRGKGHRFQRVGLLGCFSLVKKRRERKE